MSTILIVVIGVLAIGWVYLRLTAARRRLSFEEAVDRLEGFVDGRGIGHEWDYLITVRHPNPRVAAIRERILELQRSIPGDDYSSDIITAFRQLLEEIRSKPNWPAS